MEKEAIAFLVIVATVDILEKTNSINNMLLKRILDEPAWYNSHRRKKMERNTTSIAVKLLCERERRSVGLQITNNNLVRMIRTE